MLDYFENFGISIVLSLIKQSVKNPPKAAALKSVMLKIYTQIGLVYGSEPEFQSAAATVAK